MYIFQKFTFIGLASAGKSPVIIGGGSASMPSAIGETAESMGFQF
jgi:hypothetical protein